MPIVRGFRLMNALINGTLTGAQLETLLTTEGRLGDWEQVLALPGQANILVRSTSALPVIMSSAAAAAALTRAPTAHVQNIMEAVASSSDAVNALVGSSGAMNAIAASYTAMVPIAASATAMSICRDSRIAKEAFWANNAAASAIVASSTALSQLRASSAYSVTSFYAANTVPVSITLPGERYIVLGVSRNSTAAVSIYMNTVRSGFSGSVWGWSAGVSRTDALAGGLCAPVQAPYSGLINTSSAATQYLGILRVDI